MPKQTLLEMTQEILSSMDSDEINNVTDTTEAQQVAMIIRRVYYDMVARSDMKEHHDLFQLEASGDNAKPVLMTRPTTVDKLIWIKYDKKLESSDPSDFEFIKYMEPTEFLYMQHQLNTDDTYVDTMTYSGDSDTHVIPYRNDKAPDYWTSVDDSNIFFDSYDSSLDTTLQKSKTMCYGLVDATFNLSSNSFTPELDAQQFPLLVNEAKALAWAELKQAQHVKAEREAMKQRTRMNQNKRALPGKESYGDFYNLPNYGRK